MPISNGGGAGGGAAFNGGTITDPLTVEPGGAASDPAITADATGSGNTQALRASGNTLLDRAGVTGAPLLVQRDGVDVLAVDADGKTSVTPTANGNAQPALDVDATAAIIPLFRLRTNGVDVCTVSNTGDAGFFIPGSGTWLFGGSGGIQIVAPAAADIELTDSGSNIVVQVTGDGKLGFYNHGASAQQTGVAVTVAAIHAALVNLGLITA